MVNEVIVIIYNHMFVFCWVGLTEPIGEPSTLIGVKDTQIFSSKP